MKRLPTLVILLVFVFVATAGCLFGKSSVQVPAAQAAVTIKALDVLAAAGTVAVSVRTFERDLFTRGVITPAQDIAFQTAFAKTQAAADKAIDGVRDGSLALRSATRQILDTVSALVIQGQVGLTALIESLKTILSLGQSIPVPVEAH